uniref:Uncharacterized protein n=1 Tax=Oryza barthii TaxID=65489 RepID=A0A0D3G8Q5_9ORYZ
MVECHHQYSNSMKEKRPPPRRGQLKRQIARTLSNLMVPGGGKQIAAGSEQGQAAAKAHGCFRLR